MLVHKGYITTPPPIVSRVYQELSHGMEGYMDAYSLAVVPIPLPIRDTALSAWRRNTQRATSHAKTRSYIGCPELPHRHAWRSE